MDASTAPFFFLLLDKSQSYYLHWSRDSMSPVCGIVLIYVGVTVIKSDDHTMADFATPLKLSSETKSLRLGRISVGVDSVSCRGAASFVCRGSF